MQQNRVPQQGNAETAQSSSLAALAAVATRLGVETTVEQLRRRFSMDTVEPETATLVAMARDLGLRAQSLQMTFAELPKLAKALPAILRAKDGGLCFWKARARIR